MSFRIIPRLDIKGSTLIKGVQLEGLRVIGAPALYAKHYYEVGADELIYMDAVASLYGRNHLSDIVKDVARDIFIPITVGGGIRSLEDVKEMLRSGADKVAINTAVVHRPELIKEVARKFGSQCMVLSIEAKLVGEAQWEIYTDCGREKTGIDAIKWVQRGVELGAGEVLVTSIDQEGTKKGYDINLTRAISEAVDVPVIACGGMGNMEHLIGVLTSGKANAAAMASVLHYGHLGLAQIRQSLLNQGLQVRSA